MQKLSKKKRDEKFASKTLIRVLIKAKWFWFSVHRSTSKFSNSISKRLYFDDVEHLVAFIANQLDE